jgi:hypothetical protein
MTGPTPEPLEIKGELKMPSVRTRHPGVAKFAAGVVFAVGLLSGLPALADYVPNNFPNNWLQNQEIDGGHTIARHVGKTDQLLVDRYNDNYHISGASTYATVPTAAQHIQAALAIARAEYNAWEPNADNGIQLPVKTNLGYTVGRGVNVPTPRPAKVAEVDNENQVLTVMEKSGPGTCFLLTSYPKP